MKPNILLNFMAYSSYLVPLNKGLKEKSSKIYAYMFLAIVRILSLTS